MPKKIMFARLDFSTFLICCSGDLSDNGSDEKPSVAICGGSICILTGLLRNKQTVRNVYTRLQQYYDLSERAMFTFSYSLLMSGKLVKQRSGLGDACQSG